MIRLGTIAMALCLTACGGSPPPPTAAAPRPAAARRCAAAGDCARHCGPHDSAACFRAGHFALLGLGTPLRGDRFADAAGYFSRGCQHGDARACAAAAGLAMRGEPARATALADRACEAGVARGCRISAALSRDRARRRDLAARAATLDAEACRAGDGDACTALAGLYGATEEWGERGARQFPYSAPKIVIYLREARRLHERNCSAGDALACVAIPWLYQYRILGRQTPAPHVWSARACQLVGAQPGCWQGEQPSLRDYPLEGRL